MKYRFLGSTGLRVSQVGFGTMSFGGDADEQTSTQLFQQCREAGVNLFDCADVYQKGRSEELLGKLIHDCRDEVVITSKVYFPTGEGPNERVYEVAERFRDLAAEWGYHPVSLALAWVGTHPAVTAPLIGARSPTQLEKALKSVEIDLTAEEREQISALSQAPPPATDRNEEHTPHNFGAR